MSAHGGVSERLELFGASQTDNMQPNPSILDLPFSLRMCLTCIYCFWAAMWVRLVACHTRPGGLRTLLLLPVVGVNLALTPIMLDWEREPIMITPYSGLLCIAAWKVLALCIGRGPLADPSVHWWSFVGVMNLPIIPNTVFKTSGGARSKGISKVSELLYRYSLQMGGCIVATWLNVMLWWLPLLAHHWLYAFTTSLFLGAIMDVLGVFASAVYGIEIAPTFNQPWLITSFADFWARRWNLTTTYILRVLIYEPIVEGRLIAAGGGESNHTQAAPVKGEQPSQHPQNRPLKEDRHSQHTQLASPSPAVVRGSQPNQGANPVAGEAENSNKGEAERYSEHIQGTVREHSKASIVVPAPGHEGAAMAPPAVTTPTAVHVSTSQAAIAALAPAPVAAPSSFPRKLIAAAQATCSALTSIAKPKATSIAKLGSNRAYAACKHETAQHAEQAAGSRGTNSSASPLGHETTKTAKLHTNNGDTSTMDAQHSKTGTEASATTERSAGHEGTVHKGLLLRDGMGAVAEEPAGECSRDVLAPGLTEVGSFLLIPETGSSSLTQEPAKAARESASGTERWDEDEKSEAKSQGKANLLSDMKNLRSAVTAGWHGAAVDGMAVLTGQEGQQGDDNSFSEHQAVTPARDNVQSGNYYSNLGLKASGGTSESRPRRGRLQSVGWLAGVLCDSGSLLHNSAQQMKVSSKAGSAVTAGASDASAAGASNASTAGSSMVNLAGLITPADTEGMSTASSADTAGTPDQVGAPNTAGTLNTAGTAGTLNTAGTAEIEGIADTESTTHIADTNTAEVESAAEAAAVDAIGLVSERSLGPLMDKAASVTKAVEQDTGHAAGVGIADAIRSMAGELKELPPAGTMVSQQAMADGEAALRHLAAFEPDEHHGLGSASAESAVLTKARAVLAKVHSVVAEPIVVHGLAGEHAKPAGPAGAAVTRPADTVPAPPAVQSSSSRSVTHSRSQLVQSSPTSFPAAPRPSVLRRYAALQATFLFSAMWHMLLFWYNTHLISWEWFVFFTIQAPILVLEQRIIKWCRYRNLLLPRPISIFLANFLLIVVACPIFFGPVDSTGMATRNLQSFQQHMANVEDAFAWLWEQVLLPSLSPLRELPPAAVCETVNVGSVRNVWA